MPRDIPIDRQYLVEQLLKLLYIPSPTGLTDAVVAHVCAELKTLGIAYDVTRRGAVRADLRGVRYSPDRAIVSHLDTLGAIVKGIKDNGRLQLSSVGHWSARFAEGARATVLSNHQHWFRGTILPLKASGHTYGEEIDKQEVSWQNLELRLDERVSRANDCWGLGINVGDLVAIDPQPEFSANGFVNSRHLDDKAGVAAVLAAAKALRDADAELMLDCHLLFTISEEIGVGASHILHGDVAELVAVDNGAIAPGQYTSEYGVTIAMQDSSGPFDWHLTRSMLDLCERFGIEHSRDVFNHYRSDGAAAVEAGNDIRTGLVCFGLDSSHGYERAHLDSLEALSRLLVLYIQSPALFARDTEAMGPPGDLPAGDPQDTRGAKPPRPVQAPEKAEEEKKVPEEEG